MAGTYKIWCNTEQNFVTGFSDTILSECPNNNTHSVDLESVFLVEGVTDDGDDAIGGVTDALNISSITPASYAGDIQGRELVAEETILLDLKPGNGVSKIRNVVKKTGEADVVNALNQPEFKLSIIGAGDVVSLRSAERGRYAEGFTSEVAVGGNIGSYMAGDQTLTFGMYDDSDGLYFEIEGTAFLRICVKRGGNVVDIVDREFFNIDSLDGTGPSGVVLNPFRGYVWMIRFSGYSAEFLLSTINAKNGKQEAIPLHTVYSTGSSLLNVTNLPISVTLDAKNTSNPAFVNITGRKYGILGNMLSPPMYRTVGAYRHNKNPSSNIANPMFSIRRKAGTMSTPAIIRSIQSVTDAGYQTGLMQIRSGGVLNRTRWTDVPFVSPSETIMEFDEYATSITGGTVVATGFVRDYLSAGRTGEIDFYVIEDQIITFVIIELDSVGNMSVSMEWDEEF